MALSVGTRLGSYEIVNAIGAGGMGEVYRARDTKLGRDVAIELCVPRAIDLAHPACADGAYDFVCAKALACSQRHRPLRDGLRAIILPMPAGPSSLRSLRFCELRRTRRSLGEGGHPRRVLTMMPRRGFSGRGSAWPRALIPPAPSGARISYGPRRAPVVSDMIRF